MAKQQKDTIRNAWARPTRNQRPEIARATGGGGKESRRPGDSSTITRMGPYEITYQVDFGYDGRRET